MVRRTALAFLTLASAGILLACLFAGRGWVAELVFSFLAAVFPVALIVVGAGRGGRLGPLRLPLAVLALHLVAVVAAMWVLRGRVLDGPWLGGLPLAAAIQLYGLFVLTLVLVSLTYGLTFGRCGLRDEDLAELRRRFRRVEPH